MTDIAGQQGAFIGLGRMGRPIAAHLAAAGLTLHCYDVTPGFTAPSPASAASSVEAALTGADVVLTCLPTSREVAGVVEAALDRLPPGRLFVDLTSGEPAATREFAARLAGRGIGFADAPVSGGVSRAETGELSVMLGGEPADVDRAQALLAPAGSQFFRCGPVGAGQAMKALNNLVSATGLLIAAEALCLGRGFGLDPEVMLGVLNASTGSNHATQNKIRQFVFSGSYASGFGLDLMVKDLGIALGLGPDGTVPVAATVLDQWRAAQNLLGPGHDHTEVTRLPEHHTKTTLTPPPA